MRHQMKNEELTIRKLLNTEFSYAYKDFLLEKQMNKKRYIRMLSLATLFLNCNNENIKRLGYRIIVVYSNQTMYYKPLYEISVNMGLIPVSHFIEKILESEDKGNIFTEINASIGETFFINNVYCSVQQKELIDFYNESKNDTVSVVAPTSYGKTDLIISTIEQCNGKNICVITPIITHPEMYNGKEDKLIAIVTQERLLRLLKKTKNISFDYVIIDEAHGLLHDDPRNMLLASVILILENRNPNTVFKFLTPFLCEPENMKVRYADYSIKTYKVNEYIKTEKLYLVDFRGEKRDYNLYDQFLNEFYNITLDKKINSEWSFIKENASSKNIIYLNKPKDIESFARIFCREEKIGYGEKIKEALKNIAEYVHPQYLLIECLKHGVIYHHGSVPEPIRIYIENLYSELSEIQYVITSSTLLEGVNIPATSMFILDNKKGRSNLSPSDFKNLIGRVCRFSQVFHPEHGSIKKLEPQIYLLAGRYYSEKANVKKFIQSTMNVEKKISDRIENVLLENTKITTENVKKLETSEEFIENYEPGTIKDYNLRTVSTDVGKSCFINNISEFDIFESEKRIDEQITKYKNKNRIISDTTELFDILYDLFFSGIEDDNIRRFEHSETRNFYKMFLDWRITNASLNYMINSFMKYWKGLSTDTYKEKYVYVGSRWGDQIRDGFLELWTDISKKTDAELINLAIVRIKEEQDFLDNTVIKYIEVLHDLEMLDEDLYLEIKYGTCDKRIIVCVKNGVSFSLAKLLVQKYFQFIFIDLDNDIIQFSESIIEELEKNKENKIIIQELKYCL
jgi:cellulose biosynthesis protein BcsQ